MLRLAKDDKGPIYQELERVATQRESLLLTSDGVVLNGNRRLAALRALFEDDARTYSSFSHVDAIILPKAANEQDLELLEAELQMAPETKLEYGWIERRLKLRRHADVLKIPRDQIKATYRFRREEDINVELQQLALAEEYLEKYLHKPHAYREVAQSEQLFKDLEKEVRGKSGVEAEVRRLLGYLLAKEARNLGNRVYRYNPIFGRDFDKVMQRFAEDEDIDLTATEADDAIDDAVDDDDPLNGLSDVDRSPYEAFKPILQDQDQTEETAEKFSRVFESLRVRPETLCRITEFSEHESNGRELDEGERVAVEVLPVLGQSAAAVEPGDGAFDHPTPGLDDEALHPIGSLDDLGLEIGQDAGQGAVKDRPLIGAVGEQFPEKGKQTEQGRQQRETAVAILNVGGGDDAVQQQALRIDQNMPLLALDQLAGIEAVAVDASPPFSALFTL